MLLRLITRARRRLFGNALAAEAARAATIAALLLVMLLVVGTDVLSWRWLIAMPAVAFAVGALIALRRLPGHYRTARIIDARLRLYDTLATALFCSGEESARFDTGMRSAHLERAEAAAQAVRPSDAVPFRTPRLLGAAVPLVLLAGSLFVLRYVWQDKLDLRQPLPIAATYLMRLASLDPFALDAHKEQPPRQDPSNHEEGQDSADRDAKGDHSLQAASQNQPVDSANQPDGNAKSSSVENQPGQQPKPKDSELSSNSPDGSEQQEGSSGQQAQQGDSSSSLMSKISDAVRGMISRLKGDPSDNRGGQASRSQETAHQAGNQGAQRQGGQQMSQGSSQGSASQAKADGQKGDMKVGQQGLGSNSSTAASQGDSPDKQQGNSAGTDDGAKDVKQAEELAALGKISVILGKRSETISGSATLETVSGKQTLVTPYTSARSDHSSTHIAINRDEVPVTLEDYVERYFVALRNRGPRSPVSNAK